MKLQIEYGADCYDVDIEVLQTDPDAPPAGYIPPPVPRHTGRPTTRKRRDDDHICRSPLQGLVVRVNVSPGQPVHAGELVMVLEAMKMETNLTAPRDCTVKSVQVAPGAGVQVGQVLLEYD